MPLTADVRAFLEEPRFTVLATLDPSGRIQQTVMWYELRGDRIIINTARGRAKVRNMNANPNVSLCWEDGYRFLTIRGTIVEKFDDQDIAQADILALARRYNPGVSDADIDRRFSNFKREHRISYVVSIDRVTANGFS